MPVKETHEEQGEPETEPEEAEEAEEIEEVDSLFAEHLPTKDFRFRVKGAPKDKTSLVKLRRMGGGAEASWKDSVGTFRDGAFVPNRVDSEIVVLCNTITEMSAYFPRPDGVLEEFRLPKPGNARMTFYAGMNPDLRNILVGKCYEVNGFGDPF